MVVGSKNDPARSTMPWFLYGSGYHFEPLYPYCRLWYFGKFPARDSPIRGRRARRTCVASSTSSSSAQMSAKSWLARRRRLTPSPLIRRATTSCTKSLQASWPTSTSAARARTRTSTSRWALRSTTSTTSASSSQTSTKMRMTRPSTSSHART